MASTKPRQRYNALNFREKVAVIREVEKGVKKKADIAKEFGIPANTLSTFLKNKEKIFNSYRKERRGIRKRAREPENPDVDEWVLKWLKHARVKNIPINGAVVRAKAEEFGFMLGKDDFKASSGWLDGFKERNGISFKNVDGDRGIFVRGAFNLWKIELSKMIKKKLSKNVFSVDETGLFFKCTPDKTAAFKDQRCIGGKLSEERITLLIGANMDGSEKLPLLMVGRYANPRCFKNVKTKPVEYRANRKSWMTSDIFEQWLLKIDEEFSKENRKILLFVENNAAHKDIPLMNNVKVIFFPSDIISLVQPMKQGIIKTFKHSYRRLLVQNVFSGNLLDKDNAVKIDILEAARMCFSAWEQVTAKTIARCFRKAGFAEEEDEKDDFVPDVEDVSPEGGSGLAGEKADLPLEEFLNFDENVETCGSLSEGELLGVFTTDTPLDSSDEEAEREPEESTEKPVLSDSEALSHLRELRRFVEGQVGASCSNFRALDKLQEFIVSLKMTSGAELEVSEFFK